MPAPLDPAKREAIAHAIRQGGKRNEIARQHGVSPGTVTKIAKTLDDLEAPPFDRSQTKRATEARKVDQEAERAAIRGRLMAEANRFLDALHEPTVLHNFGGKDNTHNSIELPEPTWQDKQRIMTSVGIALDKVRGLDDSDRDPADEGRVAVLALVDELRRTPAL